MCDQCQGNDAASARPRRTWIRWVLLLAVLVGLIASLAEGAQRDPDLPSPRNHAVAAGHIH